LSLQLLAEGQRTEKKHNMIALEGVWMEIGLQQKHITITVNIQINLWSYYKGMLMRWAEVKRSNIHC
jgi:hypothetical protein